MYNKKLKIKIYSYKKNVNFDFNSFKDKLKLKKFLIIKSPSKHNKTKEQFCIKKRILNIFLNKNISKFYEILFFKYYFLSNNKIYLFFKYEKGIKW